MQIPVMSSNQQCCSVTGQLTHIPSSGLVNYWLVVKVLCPIQHKIGYFGDVPQANLLAWYGKLNLTTKARIHQSKEIKCTTQTQRTKARFSCLLRHPA